jgi:hypothetical protein
MFYCTEFEFELGFEILIVVTPPFPFDWVIVMFCDEEKF